MKDIIVNKKDVGVGLVRNDPIEIPNSTRMKYQAVFSIFAPKKQITNNIIEIAPEKSKLKPGYRTKIEPKTKPRIIK